MEVDIRAANKSTKDLLCNTGGTLNENIILLAPVLVIFISGLQNGDVMANPYLEVKIYPDQKMTEPLRIKTITLAYIKLLSRVL